MSERLCIYRVVCINKLIIIIIITILFLMILVSATKSCRSTAADVCRLKFAAACLTGRVATEKQRTGIGVSEDDEEDGGDIIFCPF